MGVFPIEQFFQLMTSLKNNKYKIIAFTNLHTYLYIFCAIVHFLLLNYFHRYTNLQISLQIFCCYYIPECAFAKGYKLFTFWPKIFSVALSILQSGFVAFCEKQQLSTNTDFLQVFHPNFHM